MQSEDNLNLNPAATFKSKKFLFILMLVLSYALSFDIYIPSLPVIKDYFHGTQAQIQLTISIFLVTAALCQILVGPLLDKFGPKKIVNYSIGLFCISTLGCIFAKRLEYLIILRFFQAIASGAMVVTGLSLIQYQYDGKSSVKIYAYLNMLVVASPILAPLLGSYIDSYFGWRAVFVFLFIYSCGLGMFVFLYKNNLYSKFRIKNINLIKPFKEMLVNRHYISYLISAALGSTVIFCYASISPYVYTKIYKTGIREFGLYFSLSSIVLFIGHYLTARLLDSISPNRLIFIANCILVISSVELCIFNYFLGDAGILYFWLGSCQVLFAAALLLSTSIGNAIKLFNHTPGIASALISCANALIAFSFTTLIMLFRISSANNFNMSILIITFIFVTFRMLWVKIFTNDSE